jgi:hypothetical protein
MMARPEVQERLATAKPIEYAPPASEEPEVLNVELLPEASLPEVRLAIESPGSRETQANSTVRTMRLRHHQVARLRAAGMSAAQIAPLVDMTPMGVTLLLGSPAFQNLLIAYMSEFDKAAQDFKRRLEVTAGAAINELHDRLVQTPESFNNETLRRTVETLTDRIGHGPTSKVVSTSLALTPADIRALRAGLQPATIQAAPLGPAEESHRGEGLGGRAAAGEILDARSDSGPEEGAPISGPGGAGASPAVPPLGTV